MYCGDGRAQPRQPRSLPHPQTHWASLWPDTLLGASSQSRDTVGVMGILLRTPVLQPCLPDAMKNRNTERLWRPVQLYLASNFIQPIAVTVRPVVGPFFPSGNGWDQLAFQGTRLGAQLSPGCPLWLQDGHVPHRLDSS